MKVVVTRDLGTEALDLIKARSEIELVVWHGVQNEKCDRSWLLENLKGAAGAVVMLTDPVNKEFLDAAGPSLKVVSTASVGYEHLDAGLAKERGIRVGYTPDVLTDAVADLTVLLILMAGRNGGQAVQLVQQGEWPTFAWSPFGLCGPQLSTTPSSPKRTVGFLGFGRIAQATLKRLNPFGITHCIFTSNPSSKPDSMWEVEMAARLKLHSLRRVDLEELARESDVLVVLAPGGDSTRHIVNEALLRKMKKTAVLVNTSRGTLVDSDALARALREGWIWAAGLDVVEGEPQIGADHPLVKEPRCVILPHLGSATNETRVDMMTLAARNVIAGLVGDEMPSEFKL